MLLGFFCCRNLITQEYVILGVLLCLTFTSSQQVLPAPSRIHQQDLGPTLSLLTGVPIPRNSLGSVVPELLAEGSEEELLAAWVYNAMQVAAVMEKNVQGYQNSELLLLYIGTIFASR